MDNDLFINRPADCPARLKTRNEMLFRTLLLDASLASLGASADMQPISGQRRHEARILSAESCPAEIMRESDQTFDVYMDVPEPFHPAGCRRQAHSVGKIEGRSLARAKGRKPTKRGRFEEDRHGVLSDREIASSYHSRDIDCHYRACKDSQGNRHGDDL